MKKEQANGHALSRRRFLQLSSTAVGAALLSACVAPAAPAGDAGGAVPASQAQVSLRYSHWGNEDEKASTAKTLQAFMEQNPHIAVEQMYIPESGDPYLQKMSAMAASNTLPDAALFPDEHTLSWALRGMFLDLSEIFSGEHEKVDAIQYRTPDGKIVGVSGAQEIQLIWYNRDLFDDEGIPYPPATAEEAWSWDQFLEIAKQLTVDVNGNNALSPSFDPTNIDRFGFQMGLWMMPIVTYMRSNGGDFFTEDWTGLALDTPESIEAVQMVADLMNVHNVTPKLTAGGSMSIGSGLLSRKVAMAMDGQWVLETLNRVRREEGLNFGIGVLPYIQDKVTTAIGGPIVSFSTTKYPSETMQLESFIMDPANTPEFIIGGLWMPNEKRWYHDPELLSIWIDNENHPPEYKTAVVDYSLEHVNKPLPNFRLPNWPGMWQIINPAFEQVWLGEMTADQAVAEVMPQAATYFDTEIAPLML